MLSEEAETFFTFGIKDETYKEENGKIVYTSPADSAAIDEERYRQSFLWMVQDTTYNKGVLNMTEEGRSLINVYDTILANESSDEFSSTRG